MASIVALQPESQGRSLYGNDKVFDVNFMNEIKHEEQVVGILQKIRRRTGLSRKDKKKAKAPPATMAADVVFSPEEEGEDLECSRLEMELETNHKELKRLPSEQQKELWEQKISQKIESFDMILQEKEAGQPVFLRSSSEVNEIEMQLFSSDSDEHFMKELPPTNKKGPIAIMNRFMNSSIGRNLAIPPPMGKSYKKGSLAWLGSPVDYEDDDDGAEEIGIVNKIKVKSKQEPEDKSEKKKAEVIKDDGPLLFNCACTSSDQIPQKENSVPPHAVATQQLELSSREDVCSSRSIQEKTVEELVALEKQKWHRQYLRNSVQKFLTNDDRDKELTVVENETNTEELFTVLDNDNTYTYICEDADEDEAEEEVQLNPYSIAAKVRVVVDFNSVMEENVERTLNKSSIGLNETTQDEDEEMAFIEGLPYETFEIDSLQFAPAEINQIILEEEPAEALPEQEDIQDGQTTNAILETVPQVVALRDLQQKTPGDSSSDPFQFAANFEKALQSRKDDAHEDDGEKSATSIFRGLDGIEERQSSWNVDIITELPQTSSAPLMSAKQRQNSDAFESSRSDAAIAFGLDSVYDSTVVVKNSQSTGDIFVIDPNSLCVVKNDVNKRSEKCKFGLNKTEYGDARQKNHDATFMAFNEPGTENSIGFIEKKRLTDSVSVDAGNEAHYDEDVDRYAVDGQFSNYIEHANPVEHIQEIIDRAEQKMEELESNDQGRKEGSRTYSSVHGKHQDFFSSCIGADITQEILRAIDKYIDKYAEEEGEPDYYENDFADDDSC